MEKIRKYFGEIEMTWGKVIIFAIITAVLTAVLNLIPALQDTSFSDIAVTPECWILFALFVVMNCKKWSEASLKCFVFFLVSQPLIYLIEVPFVSMGWQVFQYYRYWFIITLLTLPGAAIAYQLKRKDWISVLVLSVANALLAILALDYFNVVTHSFPHHLLSFIFCVASIVFYIILFIPGAKKRIAAFAIVVAVIVGMLTVGNVSLGAKNFVQELPLGDGEWTYSLDNDEIATVEIQEGNNVVVKGTGDGTTFVTFENADGESKEYQITVTSGGIFINEVTY